MSTYVTHYVSPLAEKYYATYHKSTYGRENWGNEIKDEYKTSIQAKAAFICLEAAYKLAQFLDHVTKYFSTVKPKWIQLKKAEDSTLAPYIPSIEELNAWPIEKINALWKLNNETLIGIIAKKEIPRFGFHSTDKGGLEGIVKSRQSGADARHDKYIWVAGYNYQLDPITTLADFYTIAIKSGCYMKEGGGIFTVRTPDRGLSKQIWSNDTGYPYWKSKLMDSSSETKFFDLIFRNRSENKKSNISYGQVEKHADAQIFQAKNLFPADEFFVQFNKYTYDTVVKGVLLNNERKYKLNSYKVPQNEEELKRQTLGLRFQAQEIIFNAFEHLEVISAEGLQKKWKKYQEMGNASMKNIDKVTTLTCKKLMDIDKKHYILTSN